MIVIFSTKHTSPYKEKQIFWAEIKQLDDFNLSFALALTDFTDELPSAWEGLKIGIRKT